MEVKNSLASHIKKLSSSNQLNQHKTAQEEQIHTTNDLKVANFTTSQIFDSALSEETTKGVAAQSNQYENSSATFADEFNRAQNLKTGSTKNSLIGQDAPKLSSVGTKHKGEIQSNSHLLQRTHDGNRRSPPSYLRHVQTTYSVPQTYIQHYDYPRVNFQPIKYYQHVPTVVFEHPKIYDVPMRTHLTQPKVIYQTAPSNERNSNSAGFNYKPSSYTIPKITSEPKAYPFSQNFADVSSSNEHSTGIEHKALLESSMHNSIPPKNESLRVVIYDFNRGDEMIAVVGDELRKSLDLEQTQLKHQSNSNGTLPASTKNIFDRPQTEGQTGKVVFSAETLSSGALFRDQLKSANQDQRFSTFAPKNFNYTGQESTVSFGGDFDNSLQQKNTTDPDSRQTLIRGMTFGSGEHTINGTSSSAELKVSNSDILKRIGETLNKRREDRIEVTQELGLGMTRKNNPSIVLEDFADTINTTRSIQNLLKESNQSKNQSPIKKAEAIQNQPESIGKWLNHETVKKSINRSDNDPRVSQRSNISSGDVSMTSLNRAQRLMMGAKN